MNGAQQRAELFANVDELMAWKKGFDLKQAELIAWQAMVMSSIQELKDSAEVILKGCNVMVECDELMTQRLDNASERIDHAANRLDIINKRLANRLDIINKRLRKLEESK